MIREYKRTDQKDLLDAWYSASSVSHPFLNEEFYTQERKNIVDLHLPNAETWVFDLDGTVVGFIALLGHEIGGLYVSAKFHRQGIGSALVDHACTIRKFLEAHVFKENVIGRRFYEKYGFLHLEETIEANTGYPQLRLTLDCLQ